MSDALATALHVHWIESIESIDDGTRRGPQAYVVCTCGDWIEAPAEAAQTGDPVLAFSQHCASASLADPDFRAAFEKGLAEALREEWPSQYDREGVLAPLSGVAAHAIAARLFGETP